MASTSKDPVQLWTSTPDQSLSSDFIRNTLGLIRDDLWVVAACVDRLVEDIALQRVLIELGMERTVSAFERSQQAYTFPVDSLGELQEERSEEGETQKGRNSLIAHFRAAPVDAQLCYLRSALLQRLDRLNTFEEIWSENSEGTADTQETFDVWEDDPWADGGTSADSISMTRDNISPTGATSVALSTFLVEDLPRISYFLAIQQEYAALRVLFRRHGSDLWPSRFAILGRIPEHVNTSDYRELLPAFDSSTNAEQVFNIVSCRPETDWSEKPDIRAAIQASGIVVSDHFITSQLAVDARTRSKPLTLEELIEWYKDRVNSIISRTGMVDIALTLLQHGASQGIPQLGELGEDLSLLSRLIYDSHSSINLNDDDDEEGEEEEEWTLARWSSLDPSAAVLAYLAHSTPHTVAQDITRLVLPYLFVLEARAERAGRSDPALTNRILYDYVLNAPMDMTAAIFEASKPTLPPAQRLIRIDEDVVRLALACLYGSDSLTEWSTMSRIFECLPAWENAQDDDGGSKADATILSLCAFVTPSTMRPRCRPTDLLVFFNPLPLNSLSRALDILDIHLESGEILARWGVPAPLNWFLQSNRDVVEQRAWANRMARRSGNGGRPLDGPEDWNWLLDDMLKLAGAGENGLKGAFGLLDREEIMQIFLSGLLASGKFDVARSILRPYAKISLDRQTIEDICLSSSREFYDNSSSGNYNFGDMKLAYECLDVPPPSERLLKEKDFIEATSRLASFNITSRPGVPISPIEIRLTKDRLSLVSSVLSSNADAYKHTQVILDLVHKLGFKDDVVAEVKTLAMLADTALQAEDFLWAYETCEKMIDTVLRVRSFTPVALQQSKILEICEVCWVACFQLGRQPEFDDVPKKLILLGRALELCPADKLHEILTSWRRLEDEDIAGRRDHLENPQDDIMGEKAGPKMAAAVLLNPVSSLSARLQEFHLPSSPLVNAPEAAAMAGRAFNRVAANFPFSVSSRGRSQIAEETERSRSGSGGRRRLDTEEVSAQASRVLQKGIGWLIGADE